MSPKLSVLLTAAALAIPALAAAQSTALNLPPPPKPIPPAPLPSYAVPGTNVVLAPMAPPANNPGNKTVISPGVVTAPSGQGQAPQPPSPAVFVSIPLK